MRIYENAVFSVCCVSGVKWVSESDAADWGWSVIVTPEPPGGGTDLSRHFKGPATPKKRICIFVASRKTGHGTAAWQCNNAVGVATTKEFTSANHSHCRTANANALGVAGA